MSAPEGMFRMLWSLLLHSNTLKCSMRVGQIVIDSKTRFLSISSQKPAAVIEVADDVVLLPFFFSSLSCHDCQFFYGGLLAVRLPGRV